MIVCHPYKFIFIKTKKTAGTSIEIALSKYCGPEDIITPLEPKDEEIRAGLGYRGPRNYRRPEGTIFNHLPGRAIRALVAPEVWDSYFKFCVERNPWDKVISLYFWLYRSEPRPSLSDFISSGYASRVGGMGGIDLYTIDGQVAVDRILRYENLPAEMEYVAEHLKLPDIPSLPAAKANFRADKRHYSAYYDEHTKDEIGRMFEKEIRLLSYSFEDRRGLEAASFHAEGVLQKILSEADELNQKGQPDRAVEKLVSGISLEPENSVCYHAIVEILLDAKRFEEALEVITAMPAGLQQQGGTEILTACCLEGLGQTEEAEAAVDCLLAKEGSHASGLNLKGMLAYKRGDLGSAEAFFRKASALDDSYGDPWTNLGIMVWSGGDKEGALDLLEQGFLLSPKGADNAAMYHAAISDLKHFGRAEKVFREMKTLYPLNRRIALFLVDILLQQCREAEAMKLLEDALADSGPDDEILQAALALREKIGPMRITGPQSAGAVSLCMIVKDEEQHLARCLRAAAPLVGEIIVVDTGSNDRTGELAAAFGAAVHPFAWTEDFSEARNFSLSKASGRWILVLDADEVIAPQDHGAFRSLVGKADPRKTAYRIVTRNYSNRTGTQGWTLNKGEYPREERAAGWLPSEKVRVFPNNPKIRFRGAVHELVEGSLQDAGIAVRPCGIPIHHYGMLDARKQTEKREAYYLLGRKKLEQQTADTKALMELGIQAGELEKYEEAAGLFRRILDLEPDNPQALFYFGTTCRALGNYEEALGYCRRASELSPGHREAAVEYARCELVAGNAGHAQTLLADTVRRFPESLVAESMLAVAFCLNGSADKGIEILDRLKEKKVDTVSHIRTEAQTLKNHGRAGDAAVLLQAVVNTAHGDEETVKLLEAYGGKRSAPETGTGLKAAAAIRRAADCFAQEKNDEAIQAVMEGIAQAPEEKELYHFLAGMLIELKLHQAALEALEALPAGCMDDPDALLLRARSLEGLGQDSEAAALLEKVDALPGRDETGASAFQRARAANAKGVLAHKLGKEETAENCFREAMQAAPDYGESYTNSGILKWASGLQREALELLEKGFVLSPTSIDSATAYFNAVSALGEFSRAEPLFRKAKADHLNNRRICSFLLDILIAKGDLPGAMTALEDALAVFGADEAVLTAALDMRRQVGPKEINGVEKKHGTLSVCMIVKNEEQHLAGCLKSLEPVADEIIVVDTGSLDRTKDIAAAFGAKVFDFPWTGDFAAARNYSISHARGSWILYYDADERLSAQDYDSLAALISRPGPPAVAYRLTARNYTLDQPQGWTPNRGDYPREEAGTGWLPSTKVRLFPNRPDIRFEGCVHEMVEPALQRAGVLIKNSELPIHHYGRLNIEKTKAKAETYYQLGVRKLQEGGASLPALKELAVQAGELRKCEEAIGLWEQYIRSGVSPDQLVFALHNMGCSYFYLGRYDEALATAKKVLSLAPAMKENVITYAKSELCAGDAGRAISALEALRAEEPEYPALYLALAAACMITGSSKTAEMTNWLRSRKIPAADYLRGFAENLVSAGRDASAIALLERAASEGIIHPDYYRLLAECRSRTNS